MYWKNEALSLGNSSFSFPSFLPASSDVPSSLPLLSFLFLTSKCWCSSGLHPGSFFFFFLFSLSLSSLVHFHEFKYQLYVAYFQILSLAQNSRLSDCLLDISTWMYNKYFKISMSITEFLIPHPTPLARHTPVKTWHPLTFLNRKINVVAKRGKLFCLHQTLSKTGKKISHIKEEHQVTELWGAMEPLWH